MNRFSEQWKDEDSNDNHSHSKIKGQLSNLERFEGKGKGYDARGGMR